MKISIEKDEDGKEWLILDGEDNTITVSRGDKSRITLDKSIIDRFSDSDRLRIYTTGFHLLITEDGDNLWEEIEKTISRWYKEHSGIVKVL